MTDKILWTLVALAWSAVIYAWGFKNGLRLGMFGSRTIPCTTARGRTTQKPNTTL